MVFLFLEICEVGYHLQEDLAKFGYNPLYKYGNLRGVKKTQNLATVALFFAKKKSMYEACFCCQVMEILPQTLFLKADLKYVDCVIEFVTKIYCNQTFLPYRINHQLHIPSRKLQF